MAATSTRPAKPAPAAPHRLEWRELLRAMKADGLISAETAQATETRFGAGDTTLHPLVRLGRAGLVRQSDGKVLDIELLTEWLAGHVKLPYLRIDPLKVDVGRVAEVMSGAYAEKHRCLPVAMGLTDVTIATCEPHDTGWISQIEGHSRKTVKLVVASPLDITRYITEFFTLAKSVKAAAKTSESGAQASFEQLVELGKSKQAARRQRPGRGAGGGLAVAVRLRPARQRHPP